MRISDWSSDVCSSDLIGKLQMRRHIRHRPSQGVAIDPAAAQAGTMRAYHIQMRVIANMQHLPGRQLQTRTGGMEDADRKSVVWGKSVSVRVDLGGRRSMKKKTRRQLSTLCRKE